MKVETGVRQHPLSPYSSHAMLHLWSDEWKIKKERELWIAVAAGQADLGVFDHIEDFSGKLEAYRKAADLIYTWRIREREIRTKHDVKARLEEFNDIASGVFYDSTATLELMHWGMTSADSVDNLSLIQMRDGLMVLASRSKELAKAELIQAAKEVPFRGLKGPVGTQQDMLDLLGTPERVDKLERMVATHFDFNVILNSVGQVYPRSLDTQVAASILALVHSQPWRTIAKGYFEMITAYSGDQWNEGDVSTSAVRRVALPGIFLAADAAVRKVKP